MGLAMIHRGNLYENVPSAVEKEEVSVLAAAGGATIERIVSTGQATPAGVWLEQDWTEWVALLTGSAALLIEGEEKPRVLAPGDHVTIPPGVRHRVEWTDADEPTVWVAAHMGKPAR